MLDSAPRVRESSTTTGTGTYTLDGAPVGFQAFGVLGAGTLCKYHATDGTDFEEGIGTVLSGPSRLERTHVLNSSNAGAAVDWGAGTKTLRCGPIAAMDLPRSLSKSVAGSGTTTLTQDEQRNAAITVTGVLTGNRVLEVDTTPWVWVFYNNTSGSFSLTVKVAGQTGIVVPQGKRVILYNDGTDVRQATSFSSSGGSEFASTTPMLFAQTAAPTGWTKSTTHNDKALRVVSGAAGSGGATAFTSVFGASKTTGAKTLATGEIPAHAHLIDGYNDPGGALQVTSNGAGAFLGQTSTGNTGGGGSHDHTLSLDLQYVDVIIATKD